MDDDSWFYCLDHHVVEPLDGCPSLSRLGPYPSAAEAASALEQVARRNQAWRNDPRYRDPDTDRDGEDENEPDSGFWECL